MLAHSISCIVFISYTIVATILPDHTSCTPTPMKILFRIAFCISKSSVAVWRQDPCSKCTSPWHVWIHVILNKCGVKTLLATVNHHSYTAVCSVTLLFLKSGYHGLRSENPCRSLPDCKQALYLSYDCEGFLTATHGMTSLFSYIMSRYPIHVPPIISNTGWSLGELPRIFHVYVVKYDIKFIPETSVYFGNPFVYLQLSRNLP